MLKLIIYYLIFQTVYVILNTIKTILTIKSTKTIASIASAITYAVYVFVLIYTVADFSIWIKAGLTALTNFVGTYISMGIIERFRKDKLWEIVATATLPTVNKVNKLKADLFVADIGYNLQHTHKDSEYVIHLYSHNKAESEKIKDILTRINAKYIVHEETVRL